MSVPGWMRYRAFGFNVAQWTLIFGLLLFGVSALEGEWDVYIRVGIALLVLDRLYS